MDMKALREEQLEKASQIIRTDDLGFEQPTLIAGADVGFEQGGDVTRAAIAVLRYPSLELVEYQIARIETQMPYIPGFLSFRVPSADQSVGDASAPPTVGGGRWSRDLSSPPSGRGEPFRRVSRCSDHWRCQKPFMWSVCSVE